MEVILRMTGRRRVEIALARRLRRSLRRFRSLVRSATMAHWAITLEMLRVGRVG